MAEHDAEQCRTDMKAVQTAADEITKTIDNVTPYLVDTWDGAAADKWIEDFRGRMDALTTLFSLFPEEEQRFIEQAEKADAAKKAKPS